MANHMFQFLVVAKSLAKQYRKHRINKTAFMRTNNNNDLFLTTASFPINLKMHLMITYVDLYDKVPPQKRKQSLLVRFILALAN